ncbi:MAG: transglycosylase domain-containing protein [Candidatus Doudnabacteria bacterium]|nr:transglycosylase domain-containing protein [Candidatus Doudnabacteria bacterium]
MPNLSKRKKILFIAGLVMVVVLAYPLALFVYYLSQDELSAREVPLSTKILDRNGRLLYEVHGDIKRTYLQPDEIPEIIRQATIAVEDKDFYHHVGFDFTAIIRATLKDIQSRSLLQGGSTISQQFVRNAVLSREKTFERKIKEAVLTVLLELRYTKAEILHMYLNEVPYGSNIYGIEAASQTFFAKPAKDLTAAEAAYLAVLPKAPTYYSPHGANREDLDERTRGALLSMREEGFITNEQLEFALAEEVQFQKNIAKIAAPHFVFYVQDLVEKQYGADVLRQGGLQITTTLDLNLQNVAEETVEKYAARNEKQFRATNASLVALDPRTGQILAMVGSRDYFNPQYGAVNVALRPRQPGSSFKPYVYAAAFKEGMAPATLLFDVRTNFGRYGGRDYIPKNYDGRTRGPISMRQALQGSLNIPAVKTLMLVGIDDAINTAESMGLTTLGDRSRYGPALVLGGAEVKLLEHTAGFGTFAAGGVKYETAAILKIEDSKGKILQQFSPKPRLALDPEIAYLINDVLSDNEARMFIFANRKNVLTLPDRKVAAKTGTTQDFRDAWTIGYVPSLATGVWVGNNDNSPMRSGADGLYAAAPIWNEFMKKALALTQTPPENFARPEGIVEIPVDSLSGKLPTPYSPSTKMEVFSSFNVPTQKDDIHVAVPAGSGNYVSTVFHSEKPDDPAWEGPVRAWALARGYGDSSIQFAGTRDPGIAISLFGDNVITALPWSLRVETASAEPVQTIELYLNNRPIGVYSGGAAEFISSTAPTAGSYILGIKAVTSNDNYNYQVFKLVFSDEPALASVQTDVGGAETEQSF